MLVYNYIEKVVQKLLPQIMQEANMCQCERCRADVSAITLNNIKPKYVVTKKGELYAKLSILEGQREADIIMQMTIASQTVKNNPRH